MGLLQNDIVQVTVEGTCFGQKIMFGQTYLLNGNGPAGTTVTGDLTTIANDFATHTGTILITKYLAMLPTSYVVNTVSAQRIFPIRSIKVENNPPALGGTNANAATVASDAMCVTFEGDVGDRHNVSNKHIGPLPDAASVAGMISAAFVTLGNAFGTELKAGWSPTGFGAVALVPVIYNRVSHAARLITSFFVGPESRVQRRRTVGLGI